MKNRRQSDAERRAKALSQQRRNLCSCNGDSNGSAHRSDEAHVG